MNSFIQEVFNKISLERNPSLWQSEDDTLMEKRLQFLSEFNETLFWPQLFNEKNTSKNLRKNSLLCNAFLKKAENLLSDDEQEKKLTLLNQALCFSEPPESGADFDNVYNITYLQIIFERAKTLNRMKCINEALNDIQFLLDCSKDFEETTDPSDACCKEYYDKLYKLKFNILTDNIYVDEQEKNTQKQQYHKLETDKDLKKIAEFVSILKSRYKVQSNSRNREDKGMKFCKSASVDYYFLTKPKIYSLYLKHELAYESILTVVSRFWAKPRL